MNYEELVSDFATRTKTNLELVERQARRRPGTAFEVTQLVNSTLGLLVFPRERWLDRIPPTTLADLGAAGWPQITVYGAVPGNNLRGLARYLRNAVAHCNVEFLPDDAGRIMGLRLWNTTRDRARDWIAELRVAELRYVATKFIEMLTDMNR